jgi:hypothetical protein
MLRLTLCLIVLSLPARVAAEDKPKEVKPRMQWFGVVKDKELRKLTGFRSSIGDAKEFEKIWNAWRPGEKVPAVDFTKEFVVMGTADLFKIDAFLLQNNKGDLAVITGGGGDKLAEGFSYGLAIISREGVKTVDGVAIGK